VGHVISQESLHSGCGKSRKDTRHFPTAAVEINRRRPASRHWSWSRRRKWRNGIRIRSCRSERFRERPSTSANFAWTSGGDHEGQTDLRCSVSDAARVDEPYRRPPRTRRRVDLDRTGRRDRVRARHRPSRPFDRVCRYEWRRIQKHRSWRSLVAVNTGLPMPRSAYENGGPYIRALAIDPRNTATVYAGVSLFGDELFAEPHGYGVYKRTVAIAGILRGQGVASSTPWPSTPRRRRHSTRSGSSRRTVSPTS
jgi:hypothetical protein